MTLRRAAQLDQALTEAICALPHHPAVDASLSVLSQVTDHANAWLVVGVAGTVVDASRRGRWLQATGRIAATEATSRAIKRVVARERPRFDGLAPLAPVPDPLSLPSSHTADAVAAVRAFEGLLPGHGLRALALIQAASRPYLGVHYVSDVAVGASVGLVMSRLDGRHGRAITAAIAAVYLTRRFLPSAFASAQRGPLEVELVADLVARRWRDERERRGH